MNHVDALFAALSSLVALFALIRGVPLLSLGLSRREDPDAPLHLARGARWFITALALACIAAGLCVESDAFVLFGVVFLLEELYETTAVVWIFTWGRRRGYI